MTRFKLLAFVALITLAFGVALVADALAGEKVKVVRRNANHMTTFQSVKVGDVEGHNLYLFEAKGITFDEKWGVGLDAVTGTMDDMNGESTGVGYDTFTFPDGSTFTARWEGKGGPSGSQGTWTCIKGTGKFAGMQGHGTWKTSNVGPGQFVGDDEGEYTLP